MLVTVIDIKKKWGRLSEVFQAARLIWLSQSSPCLFELTWTAKIGERKLVLEAAGADSEWGGNGGAAKITELVETPGVEGGLALFPVFGT